MADDDPKRTTSFAKTVKGLEQDQKPLDLTPPLSPAFNDAVHNLAERLRESRTFEEKDRQSGDRKPAYAPSPELNLRPGGSIRRAVDRKIDYEKLRGINAAAKRRTEASKSRSLSRDFERER